MDDIFIAGLSTSKSLLSFVSLFRSLIMFEICFVDMRSIVLWRFEIHASLLKKSMKNQTHGMMNACMREFAFHTCKSEPIRNLSYRKTNNINDEYDKDDRRATFLSTIEANSSRY